jgi:peroxiredoxin
MRFGSAIALLILLMPVTAWILGREAGTLPVAQSRHPHEDSLSKLSMEPVEKRLAPDFRLKNLDGNAVRLYDLKGKVVLLNFWATWCPSCRFEMPAMEALHKELSSQGLVVLTVAFRESAEDVRAFYKEHSLSLPALLDHNAEAFELYDTWSLPTTFLIDKRGYVVGKAVGYREWNSDQTKAFFTQLLKESA